MVILCDIKPEELEKVFYRFASDSSKVRLTIKSRPYDNPMELDVKDSNAVQKLCRLYAEQYDTATFYREGKFLRVLRCLEEVGKIEKANGGHMAQLASQEHAAILSEWLGSGEESKVLAVC